MTIGFKSPFLEDELPPFRCNDLSSVIEELQFELDDFELHFEKHKGEKPINPFTGELDYDEWIIFHNKHKLQFPGTHYDGERSQIKFTSKIRNESL